MHLLDTILVAVPEFTISGSLDQLIVQTYRTAWERSKARLRMEVFRGLSFQNGLDESNGYDVEVSDLSCTWIIAMIKVGDPIENLRDLMLEDTPCRYEVFLEVDSVLVGFSLAGKGTKVSMRAVHMHCLVS